ncbi:MAG: hypothetical protein WCE79_05635 [Xanthobacteraceae bacterium]|jgi:hypothetical protein
MALQNVFTGKTASITLSTSGTLPEQADANAVLATSFGDTNPVVGRATGIRVMVQTDLEEFHEIGHRHPIVLHPGDIHISGSIDRAYLSGAMLMLLLGRRGSPDNQPPTYPQPAFTLNVFLQDPAVPTQGSTMVLDGVKLQNWGFTMPEDDFVMENVTFKALTISVLDFDTGNRLIPQFPN